MTDTGPLFVSSGDLIADRRYQWALDLVSRGDLAAAADLLAQTVELAPGFAAGWFTLGEVREKLGDRDGAVAAFARARDVDLEDRQGAGLQLARLGSELGSGTVNPAMSEAYVRHLFDQYAGRYDTALTEHLRYRGPAVLLDAVQQVMRSLGCPPQFGDVLDIGCGTGLAGAVFRPLAGHLVGVDLSPAMIAKADEKGVYDETHVAKIEDFLSTAATEDARYDLVLAADVFVYVGDLAPVFAGIGKILAPGGLLAFTVETQSSDGVKLLPTLRFAHGENHLRALLVANTLAIQHFAETSVRSEKGVPVDGLVVVAIAP
jgi:predicted TPR repeat methyltransferase